MSNEAKLNLIHSLLEVANAELDAEVYSAYIVSIIEDDLPREDVKHNLVEFLMQVEGVQAECLADTILDNWSRHESDQHIPTSDKANVDDNLGQLITSTQVVAIKSSHNLLQKDPSKPQIANYYDGEDDEDEDFDSYIKTDLKPNTNAENISKEEKEKRRKMKEDFTAKKVKDKQDRAAQKQKQLDRQEAEKKRTQKGERRR